MKVTETELPGVILIEPEVFDDSRGVFVETFQQERYEEALGQRLEFVQDNHSRSRRGVIRGLHFQAKHPQGKLVRVVHGEVFDVVVDVRPNSATFGQSIGVTLSEDNQHQLFIPPGYAHGFQVVSEMADFEYKCTSYYAPDDESGLVFNDPHIGIRWPISTPIVSDKDRAWPTLEELRTTKHADGRTPHRAASAGRVQPPCKPSIEDFAILGGEPAFAEPLHVGRPFIGDRNKLLERIEGSLDRRQLTNEGPLVQEFEETLREVIGARHVVTCVNGTMGLLLLAHALELKGEVIVPSFTYIATPHAMRWNGLDIVFCDVDPKTHNIDPQCVEDLISPRTSAVLGVHLWGRPCPIDDLEAIGRKHGIEVLFDAAHAFNVGFNGKKIGNFGRAEVLSFHATKIVNSLEGGAIVTNDDELAERLRALTNFGSSGDNGVVRLGLNAKMNEFSAAMGLTTLDALDVNLAVSEGTHATYCEHLDGIAGLTMAMYKDVESPNYEYVIAEIDEHSFGLSRDQLVAILTAERVLARRYFQPGCHRMEPYRSSNPVSDQRLRHTDQLSERVICMPCGAEISEDQIVQICELIRLIATEAPALRTKTEGYDSTAQQR